MTRKSPKFPLITLAIALVIVLSGCGDPMSLAYLVVNRVIVVDNTPYLLVSEKCSPGIGDCAGESHPNRYFTSRDYGKTWQEIYAPPMEMPPEIEKPENSQIFACVESNSQICYSITGKAQIEMTRDGGKTWLMDWQMPVGREEFIQNNPEALAFVTPDTIPYDLGIVENQDKHFVIVAMGNQGVLVKSPGGNWGRYAVLSGAEFPRSAIPLPYQAKNFDEAMQYIGKESIWALFLAFIFLVFISFWGWGFIHSHADTKVRPRIRWSCLPFFLTTSCLFLLVFIPIAVIFIPGLENILGRDPLWFFWENPPLYICTLPVLGLILSWLGVIIFLPGHKLGAMAALAALVFSVIFLAGIWSPFTLWAFGIIPVYEIAFALATIMGLLTAFFGFRTERHIAKIATQQESRIRR